MRSLRIANTDAPVHEEHDTPTRRTRYTQGIHDTQGVDATVPGTYHRDLEWFYERL